MSHLATDQIKNQVIEIPLKLKRSATISAIRLRILKHGILTDGSFVLSLNSGNEILGEVAITGLEIQENITSTYATGMLTWQFNNPIRLNKKSDTELNLVVKLTVNGLTESDTNYLALVRQHEFKFIEEFGMSAPMGAPDYEEAWYSAYGMEIYTI